MVRKIKNGVFSCFLFSTKFFYSCNYMVMFETKNNKMFCEVNFNWVYVCFLIKNLHCDESHGWPCRGSYRVSHRGYDPKSSLSCGDDAGRYELEAIL